LGGSTNLRHTSSGPSKSRRLLQKNNTKCHEKWLARKQNGGGRGGDTFNSFIHASSIDYNFSWPPGKSSTPTKEATKSGAKNCTSQLIRQAHQAVAQRKDLVQALSEAFQRLW
jgi:hypothetical protein